MSVINPIWFYLMSVCEAVKILAILASVASGLLVAGCIECMCEGEDGEDFLKRFGKKFVAALCISIAVVVLCPSSETLEKMLIAQNVTYERVEQATDVVSNVYEDIMSLFEKDKS